MPQPNLQDRRPVHVSPVLSPTIRLTLYAEPASGVLVVQDFKTHGRATAVTTILPEQTAQ